MVFDWDNSHYENFLFEYQYGEIMKKLFVLLGIIFIPIVLYMIYSVFHPIPYFANKVSLADYYSGGQLFVDILLLPIAVIGFYITYNEFRKNLFKSSLRHYWENGNLNDDQIVTINCKKNSDGRYYLDSILPIVLINNGDIIPRHYLVILETDWNINKENIKTNIGVPINSEHWKSDTDPGKFILRFYSHGKFPAYPDSPQTLCSITKNRFPSNPTLIENTTIYYTIYSDSSNKVAGKLSIEINNNFS